MTIRLDDRDIAALKGVEEKPAPKAPGYWRCVFNFPFGPCFVLQDAKSLGDGLWITGPRWPSEEVADQKALEDVDWARRKGWSAASIDYVRAEYFPDYGGGA